MKACSCCGVVKEPTEFQVRRASADGLTASCKACLKIRDATRYLKEKPYRSLMAKAYKKTENGKAAHARAVKAWKEKNALRRAAHVILGNAVRDGRVAPLPCLICGEKAEAHHPDYDSPLNVVWLCTSHHNETHAMARKLMMGETISG